jgi:ribosomal protein S18 acetylase RimI-like enzyme
MNVLKWDKQTRIFENLDLVYKTLSHCDVYYIPQSAYAVLNSKPAYHLYQRLGIAEIQDIYVMPDYRRQGLASKLIHHCETQAEGDMVGISVPVSPQFGAAQRLYHKLGYAPDGNGVTYERHAIEHNATVKLNDDLCLMLVKELENKP